MGEKCMLTTQVEYSTDICEPYLTKEKEWRDLSLLNVPGMLRSWCRICLYSCWSIVGGWNGVTWQCLA